MDTPRWLDDVRHELTRRKLPRRYVERLIVELGDHITDFKEDSMNKDAQELPALSDRMGEPGQVADRAAFEYCRQRFSARHPWLTFAAMPLVLLPTMWLGFGVVMIAAVYAIEAVFTFDAPFPLWGKLMVALALYAMIEAPIALSAALVCKLANRARVAWHLPMLGCLLLGLISIQVCPVLRTHNADGMWTFYWVTPYFDFGLSQYSCLNGTVNGESLLTGMARVTQSLQFAMPLVIGGCAFWRPQRPTLFGLRRAVTV